MTNVNILFHRLLVSETQTDRRIDRQDKFVIDTYIYIKHVGDICIVSAYTDISGFFEEKIILTGIW